MLTELSHLVRPELILGAVLGAGLALLPRRLLPMLALGLVGLLCWEPKLLQLGGGALSESSKQQNIGSARPDLRVKADENGHFQVTPVVNGVPIRAMIDTGATMVSLSYEDAERLKLNPDRLNYDVKTRTANGVTWAARVKLADVRVGTIHVQNITTLVGKKGALHTSLLGMSFLKNVRLRIEGGELALYK